MVPLPRAETGGRSDVEPFRPDVRQRNHGADGRDIFSAAYLAWSLMGGNKVALPALGVGPEMGDLIVRLLDPSRAPGVARGNKPIRNLNDYRVC